MKQEKADGPKIFMRASEKYTRADRSPEKIFTTFSCAVPYRHGQPDMSLPLAALSGDRSSLRFEQESSLCERSKRRQQDSWQARLNHLARG